MKDKMRDDVRFFTAIFPRQYGPPLVTEIGVGADQSLWFDAAVLGYDLERLEKLRRDVGAKLLLDPVDGSVFVEARAVIANCKSPEVEARLVRVTDQLVEMLHPSNFRR